MFICSFACCAYVRVENGNTISLFDLNLIEVDQCVNITCVTWKSKTCLECQFGINKKIKQDFTDHS